MDETLRWQVRLAKSNINITSVQFSGHNTCVICYEFPYHPKPGQVKWVKTADEYNAVSLDTLAKVLPGKVLELRKELEG